MNKHPSSSKYDYDLPKGKSVFTRLMEYVHERYCRLFKR